eukprot:364443-Chlamydomonas_euryale.AAC.35
MAERRTWLHRRTLAGCLGGRQGGLRGRVGRMRRAFGRWGGSWLEVSTAAALRQFGRAAACASRSTWH